mgnify:CR=1 FL=1
MAEWRQILDGNGLVFGVVGILDDIPDDKQMLDNEVLVPFENDTMMTISSPIWVDGSKKVQPRKPPGLGEHSDVVQKAFLMHQPTGEGHVIAFAEDPNHRGYAEATELLFLNAVLLGPAY